jgi:hypothetical protein
LKGEIIEDLMEGHFLYSFYVLLTLFEGDHLKENSLHVLDGQTIAIKQEDEILLILLARGYWTAHD